MLAEPIDLTQARLLLAKCEMNMHQPEGLALLSEALSLLAEVRANADSKGVRQVALNLSVAYARKAQAHIDLLLTREPTIHWETVGHWQKGFAECERSGLALPTGVAQTRSKLGMGKWNRHLALSSASEREELLEDVCALKRT